MPSLVLAEPRLARRFAWIYSMSNMSARVSRASADSLRHVADREALCESAEWRPQDEDAR
jgi:hypothetical protein